MSEWETNINRGDDGALDLQILKQNKTLFS